MPGCKEKCVVNEAVGEAAELSSLFLNKSLNAIRCPVAAEFIYQSAGASSSFNSPTALITEPSPSVEDAELWQGPPSDSRRLLEVRKSCSVLRHTFE